MWLLTTNTIELKYFQTVDPDYVQYGILSHTWEDEEVSFEEMQARHGIEGKRGYQKIMNCCKQARSDGYSYVWIDTCCIDKRSSAELSEAINSMYTLYKNASDCYVYLSDVGDATWFADDLNSQEWFSQLHGKRWFSRGWTLQELIAPMNVTFFAVDWTPLGTKIQFCSALSKITGVDAHALLGKPLSKFNVAERMSWASERQTTRIEDVAYSLLGIFDINMPLLYGEGDSAFVRLQERIIETTEDFTIFAWRGNDVRQGHRALLASSPDDFRPGDRRSAWTYAELSTKPNLDERGRTGLKIDNWDGRNSPPSVTARGIKMQLPRAVETNPSAVGGTVVLCSIEDDDDEEQLWLCLKLIWEKGSEHTSNKIAVRDYAALETRERLHTKMEEIYGMRSLPSHDPWSLCLSFLRRIEKDMLKSLPPIEPLAVAHWLVKAEWCESCRTYAREHQKRCVAITKSDESAANLECFALQPYDSQSEDPFGMKALSLFLVEHKAEIYKFDCCLSNFFASLPRSIVKLLLCCLLAKINTVVVAKSLGVANPWSKDSWAMDFLGRLANCLIVHHTLGSFTIAVTSQIMTSTDMAPSFAFLKVLPYANLISCAMLLAEANDTDQIAIGIAQVTLMREHGNLIGPRIYWETLIGIDAKMYQRPVDVLRRFKKQMGRRPSLKETDVFIAWLRDGFRSWARFGPEDSLISAFASLREICNEVEHGARDKLQKNMGNVAGLLWAYACDYHERTLPTRILRGERRIKWKKIDAAVLEDIRLHSALETTSAEDSQSEGNPSRRNSLSSFGTESQDVDGPREDGF